MWDYIIGAVVVAGLLFILVTVADEDIRRHSR